MTATEIAYTRLHNQQIAQQNFKSPPQIIEWLGAMQAQDYYGAKWSVALRLPDISDADVEQAIADRTIIRTWALRSTLHFVSPADVHWMLDLLSPRLVTMYASYYRKLELDKPALSKITSVMIDAMRDGRQLMRNELRALLERKRIATHDMRLNFILLRTALEKIICFGVRNGQQFTYTLLDEWSPRAKTKTREEGLAELATRYFSSHSPATLHDFVWWSGLKVADAREAIHMITGKLAVKNFNGTVIYTSENTSSVKPALPSVYLLPGFDEYILGYKNRSAILDFADVKAVTGGGNARYSSTIISNGRVVGIWKRAFKKDQVVIDVEAFKPFNKTQQKKITVTANRFAAFLNMELVMKW